MDDSARLWVAADSLDASVNATQEFLTQTGATLLVPAVGFAEILLNFGSKD